MFHRLMVHLCFVCLFFFLSLSFMYHGTRADINECEQVPKPCAHQCSNSPGSFKCICLPGQQLLGDGKSCAGLERLSNYGTQYSSYTLERFSPVRSDYQPSQHYRQYSQLYSSYSEYRNSRASFSRNRRTIRKTCPEGSEANHETCVGKCQPYCIPFCALTSCLESKHVYSTCVWCTELKAGLTQRILTVIWAPTIITNYPNK